MTIGLNYMSTDSKPSKTATGEVDASQGFITLQEVQNLWTERMRKLDTVVWPKDGRQPYRDELIEFFATLKIELFARSKTNYAEYIRRRPDPALARAKTAAAQVVQEAQDTAYSERQARLARAKTY